jgi:hypothetical protein
MTLFFPDVSSLNASVSLAGALTVCVKATQGTWYADPFYGALASEAVAHGAHLTAYHFLEQGSAATQAANAHSVAGRTPLMVDFEPLDPPAGRSYPTLADACGFIDAYRAQGGVTHLVYLPRWYWGRGANGLDGASLQPLLDRGMLLWSSDYTSYTDASDGPGWMPYGGMAPLVWQYSETIAFGGLAAVDFSAFRGHYAGRQDAASVAACLAEFKSLAATGKYPVTPPPPAPLPAKVPVPAVAGMTAARAHNRISAAHLVADTSGIPASDIVTGTSPSGGSAEPGSVVRVHAGAAPQLALGATSGWVAVAQADLNKSGAHLGVDSQFGQATLAKVMAFQSRHGLAADGVIGPRTWAALGSL